MYHGTTESRSNQIWKHGLTPFKTRNYQWSEKGGYLTTNPTVAQHFGDAGNYPPEDRSGMPTGRPMMAFRPGKESVVIVTVSTKGLDPKKFKEDPRVPDSWVYFGTIPANNIVDWKVID